MLTAAPLSTIIALARAGALDHAWYEFRAAGYDARSDDPAALTVKGRLLKDKALRASGEARRRFYLESSEAYRRSAELLPATYPLINAATLALLSGDRERAEADAREVLERIAREPDEPETPYWRAATEAEALLLLGRGDEARAALAAALAAAPRAWEDHASTLRQFVLIHDELRADPQWLDALRPPRSLAYWGHWLPADEDGERAFRAEVADLIARERIGFGFGALAAGTDILIAEALLEAGAELHVVLASDPESFAIAGVDAAAPGWRWRFAAALEAAESLDLIRPLDARPDAARMAIADQVAAGAARLNAERLMSDSLSLAVGGEASDSAHALTVAAPAGSRPLDLPAGAASPPPLALLSISVGSAADPEFESRLQEVRTLLGEAGATAVDAHLAGDEILVGMAGVGQAAEAARAVHSQVRGRMPVRIAGHFGLVPALRDPFLDRLRPTEAGAAIVKAIARATPPDTVCVSLDFAATLAADSADSSCAHWIGELRAFDAGPPIPLFALRPASSED